MTEMTEIEKMYENAGIKSEYRYDCKLADTIIPEEIYPLLNCSKGEIKDFCTDKQYYLYCKVYKVNKIYPPFTAEKQLKIIEWLISYRWWLNLKSLDKKLDFFLDFDEKLAKLINRLWESFDDQEKEEIRNILK